MSSHGRITIEIDQGTRTKLQGIIKDKLAKISSYTDDVLPEYVLVMVGNGKTEAQVSEDLEAFLGRDNAKDFSRWLWETLQSPNFGLAKGENQPKEEVPMRKLSSQIVPINRDDDIVGSILGDDKDDFSESYENERERTHERERDRRDRTRESDRDKGRDRNRYRDRDYDDDRHRDRGRNRSPDFRERRERDGRDEYERERDRERSDRSLSSFIGRVRSDSERSRERSPDLVREDRSHRLRTSASALPARLVMNAVEQAAASTKRKLSQDSTTSVTSHEADTREESVSEPKGSVKRRKADESEEREVRTAKRPVSFTITLDGLAKLPKKRSRQTEESETGSPSEDQDNENGIVLNAGNVAADIPSFDDGTLSSTQGEVSKRKRCTFWPQCSKGASCPFYHPTENCKHFPNCPFGKKCLYIHPSLPCKFGVACTRPNCNFTHPPPLFAAAMGVGFGMPGMVPMKKQKPNAPPCRNGFACTTPNCKFAHPAAPCKFGPACTRGPLCPFSHAPPCRYGASCTRVGCTFAHFAKNTTWTAAQARSDAAIPPAGKRAADGSSAPEEEEAASDTASEQHQEPSSSTPAGPETEAQDTPTNEQA